MEASRDVQVNWESAETQIRMNPRLDAATLRRTENLLKQAPSLAGHLWVQSSGSTQGPDESAKWIALSKNAFLASGAAVNRHLQASREDVWGLCLPLFHVSGLSILARCHLAGSSWSQFAGEWEPRAFAGWLRDNRISLLSLVPTQLFDLLEQDSAPPPALRAVVLGGARLEPALYRRARERGWPVLPSFGMTEFCSQIATARSDSPDLILLSHVEARTDADDTLWLRSASLFTGFLQERREVVHWEEPATENGFWRSPDRARLNGGILEPLGRAGDYVKIKGEGVNLTDLRARFHEWLAREWPQLSSRDLALTALPDAREGHRLILACESEGGDLPSAVALWNRNCFPPERLSVRQVQGLPRSSLGKIQWGALNQKLSGR